MMMVVVVMLLVMSVLPVARFVLFPVLAYCSLPVWDSTRCCCSAMWPRRR